MKDIVLALGGGGVKGFAHVGVLKVLEKNGFRIKAISGTSAGGIIGSLYSAGYKPDEIEERLCKMDQGKLFGRLPGDGPAMMGLSGVIELLRTALGEIRFEDLSIPFAVTAVDLDSARLLALRRGLVSDAVLATIAVPGIFPPRVWEGMRLIDGGVLDPVPVALARYLTPNLPVAAVVLSPRREEWVKPAQPRLLENLPFLANYISRIRIAQAFNIFMRSIDIAGAELTEMRLQIDQPEVLIRPEVGRIGFLDPVSISDVVRTGEAAAEAALPDLEQIVSLRGRLTQRLNRYLSKRVVLDWEIPCE